MDHPMTPNDRTTLDQFLLAINAAEAGPSAADIATAPRLELWQPMLSRYGMPILWGRACGHPRLGDDMITTSALIALDAEAGWARTFSRWYQLGTAFVQVEKNLVRDLGKIDLAVGVIVFDLPGYTPLNDSELLARLLATRIDSILRLSRAARQD
jgi:hypothetical protein